MRLVFVQCGWWYVRGTDNWTYKLGFKVWHALFHCIEDSWVLYCWSHKWCMLVTYQRGEAFGETEVRTIFFIFLYFFSAVCSFLVTWAIACSMLGWSSPALSWFFWANIFLYSSWEARRSFTFSMSAASVSSLFSCDISVQKLEVGDC